MQQKGAAIRSTLRAVEALYGPDVVLRLKGHLPADVRAQIELAGAKAANMTVYEPRPTSARFEVMWLE